MYCWLWLSLALGPLDLVGAIAPVDVRSYSVGSWLVVETNNFRVHSHLAEPEALELAGLCESHRADLQAVWLEPSNAVAWSPKCDVYLHASSGDYNRALGHIGDRSVGSTRMNFDREHPTERRIDLRADATDWSSGALPHELTHVVLGDVFGGRPIPRWADEGMAMLAESSVKKRLRMARLKHLTAGRIGYSMSSLLAVQGLPEPHLRDSFYSQSAALVSLLVAEHGSKSFVKFVRKSQTSGQSSALDEVYGFATSNDLQRLWDRSVSSQREFNLVDLWTTKLTRVKNVSLRDPTR
ncbi:MAG: peptidase MA family metallohydrolase [Planctomycetales bacterium]|nr:peptidase MA family metallohydrolase [Planctomycetales bacterium]